MDVQRLRTGNRGRYCAVRPSGLVTLHYVVESLLMQAEAEAGCHESRAAGAGYQKAGSAEGIAGGGQGTGGMGPH